MTLEGADGAPERLDELKTMHEDGHEHRSLQLDRQQHGCSPNLMPLTVTACPRARSDLTCLSGSMAALRAPCALPCVAMLVGSCGRAGTRGSRLQGSGMYRVSKSDESLAGQACNTPTGYGVDAEGMTRFLVDHFLLAPSRPTRVRRMHRVALFSAHIMTCSDF